MSQTRQLSAIMFTDIVGYSALMGKDEQKAFELLKINRELQKPIIEEFNGRWIKELGDGVMASFTTISDAVFAAIKIQQACTASKAFQLRIGIHDGEIVFDGDDIFGDAVNIAFRIQALAHPGSIWLSESVQKNIANKHGIVTEFVKTEHLKNIKEPVRIYQVKTGAGSKSNFIMAKIKLSKKSIATYFILLAMIGTAGFFVYKFLQKDGSEISTALVKYSGNSIAVLPFTDNSKEKNQEHLGDGIAEEILNVLTRINGLRVKGRATSFSFKNETDFKKIAEKLSVEFILTGSTQVSDKRIRISVQLINPKTGDIIWPVKFDEELTDIFIIEDKIADSISKKLELTFLNEPIDNQRKSVNPEAYETVLKGNLVFNRGNFSKAIEYYTQAIAIDSTYAYSYIRMGWTIYQLTLYNKFQPKEGFAKAALLLEKGLSLKPTLSEKQSAHHALAYINLWQYNWKNTLQNYEEVKKIDPKPNTVFAYYNAIVLNKTDEAISIMKDVVEENPLDILSLRDYSVLQYLGKKFDDALNTCDKIIELDSTFSEAYRLKGSVYASRSDYKQALFFYNKAYSLGNPWAGVLTITLLPLTGRTEEAKKIFQQMEADRSARIPSLAKGLIYFSLGEKDKAFEWLNRSFDEKDFWLVSLRLDPIWKPLQSDPRFKELISKLKFS